MKIKTIVLILAGIAFALPSLFFGYYTARLLYLNLTSANAAAHRSGGMLIGAIVFPLASIIFGIISWLFFRSAWRSKQNTNL